MRALRSQWFSPKMNNVNPVDFKKLYQLLISTSWSGIGLVFYFFDTHCSQKLGIIWNITFDSYVKFSISPKTHEISPSPKGFKRCHELKKCIGKSSYANSENYHKVCTYVSYPTVTRLYPWDKLISSSRIDQMKSKKSPAFPTFSSHVFTNFESTNLKKTLNFLWKCLDCQVFLLCQLWIVNYYVKNLSNISVMKP